MPSRSHYEFLGVTPAADAETLRAAFRRLSKDLHPDTTSLPPNEASDQFQKLCEVYELLADPERRRIYDLSLDHSNWLKAKEHADLSAGLEGYSVKVSKIGFHRPFSGGELFSLLLLVVSIVFSLFLALTVGFLQGKELQFSPSWMLISQIISNFLISI